MDYSLERSKPAGMPGHWESSALAVGVPPCPQLPAGGLVLSSDELMWVWQKAHPRLCLPQASAAVQLPNKWLFSLAN